MAGFCCHQFELLSSRDKNPITDQPLQSRISSLRGIQQLDVDRRHGLTHPIDFVLVSGIPFGLGNVLTGHPRDRRVVFPGPVVPFQPEKHK